MISKISGKVDTITDTSVVVELSGLYFDVLMPPYALDRINNSHHPGDEILLFTKLYIEGGLGGANLVPRLIGFLEEADSRFFEIYTTVKGLGDKKALKSLAISMSDLAGAIENSEVFKLKNLPGIGGRMADKIIAELKGKLIEFVSGDVAEYTGEALPRPTELEGEAIEILITQLGFRRVEAENMIRSVMKSETKYESVEEIIQVIFQRKAEKGTE
ncbi:MAG: hypothetical protein GY863_19765 [bacterium]|nr:hypothetical protein [bacterium]